MECLFKQRWRIVLRLYKLRFREKLEFDSPFLKRVIGYLVFIFALLCYVGRRTKLAFLLFAGIHSAACSPETSRAVEEIVASALNARREEKKFSALCKILQEHSSSLSPTDRTRKFFDNPKEMLVSMVMVLKSSSSSERGVVSLRYSYAFPLFAKLFDIEKISERYFFVLEPSWSGYCNLDILSYTLLDCPVFVQTYEPRDREFISRLGSNLIPVPISSNWWVDHRVFRPLAHVSKDVDLIMVAGWAGFKRHHRLFQALGDLRRQGVMLRTVLVGYPMQRTKDEIFQEALLYRIEDQVEIYEWITQQEVNYQLNRAKVNLIWSRREGGNRAVIEGLFAGAPCLLREGHNYGYHYPYINNDTGCFVSEKELPEKLVWFTENYKRFSPRTWALEHMSCQNATNILTESIGCVAKILGEKWEGSLVTKVNELHGMRYWNPEDQGKFAKDYEFLTTCIRTKEMHFTGKDNFEGLID